MSKDKTNQKGITLIALVITIIVMLILVGVSVTVALNGGLFTTAKEAAEGTATKRNEELELSSGKVEINGEWYNSIDEYVNGNADEDEGETLEQGLYSEDGTFTSWETLLENGDLVVIDGELVGADNTSGCSCGMGHRFNGSGVLVIDNSVTAIGDYAFSCPCKEKIDNNLTTITIPDSVTSIGSNAFTECSNLTTITIPDSVTSIGAGAFTGCSNLASIKIPDGVTIVGNSWFYGCRSLTSIDIPDSVTSIDYYAFANTGLTTITIPDSVTNIGECAFYECSSLTTITIPDSVTNIGKFAFGGGIDKLIGYTGTLEQWNSITFDNLWNSYSPEITIHCTDGDITIPANS